MSAKANSLKKVRTYETISIILITIAAIIFLGLYLIGLADLFASPSHALDNILALSIQIYPWISMICIFISIFFGIKARRIRLQLLSKAKSKNEIIKTKNVYIYIIISIISAALFIASIFFGTIPALTLIRNSAPETKAMNLLAADMAIIPQLSLVVISIIFGIKARKARGSLSRKRPKTSTRTRAKQSSKKSKYTDPYL